MNLTEITDTEKLVDGQAYIAFGESCGDGHLSFDDYPDWRRVRFDRKRNAFSVIEKESSDRGAFKVKRVFALPSPKEM